MAECSSDLSHLQMTRQQLYDNFMADSRPWVVAYSGGKDSTLLLQLVYELLLSLPVEKQKPVHVIASDTQVEAPIIADYLHENLRQIEKDARQKKLNIFTHLVTPDLESSFWYNVIGKGYLPPNRWFRWCTSKLKIKPVRRAIEAITAEHGSVILLLGTRRAESSNRSRQMQNREYSSRSLNPHHEIPNASVMQPIAHWLTEDMWTYL